MAIDNRPTFGSTLLKGMLEREQMTIEQEKLKMAQQTHKLQQEAFELQVQQEQYKMAKDLAMGKAANMLAGSIQGPQGEQARGMLEGMSDIEDAAAIPVLQFLAQQGEAQLGREHATELQQERLESAEGIAGMQAANAKHIAEIRANTDRYIADNRNFLDLMNLATSTANNRQAMSASLVEAGYDIATANAISGASGNPDADAAMLQERYAQVFKGQDPQGQLAQIEEDQVGVGRAMRVVTASGMDKAVSAGVTQALNKLKTEGRAPTDEDINEIFTEIERFATDNEKKLFPSRKTRDADRDQYIDEQQQLALLALQTAYTDPSIGEGRADPVVVQDAIERQGGSSIFSNMFDETGAMKLPFEGGPKITKDIRFGAL